VYGGRLALPAGASQALRDALRGFRRQALHAARLELRHPVTGEELRFDMPSPPDFQGLLQVLREDVA
jgi:23S rRNA pseudouridine1911/1915/1917 synthase